MMTLLADGEFGNAIGFLIVILALSCLIEKAKKCVSSAVSKETAKDFFSRLFKK